MIPVIFDNDIGIDDAMALLLLDASSEVNLLGITTRFGNASIETTTRNALIVRDLFNIQAPVFKGAGEPIGLRLGEGFPVHVHGKNGLGDIPLPAPHSQPEAEPAAQALVDLTRVAGQKVTVIAVGGLTNIAEALRLDPELPERIDQVIVMGGAFGYHQHRGNVSPVAEANIASDPLAADRVFSSKLKSVIVGLDVTHEIRMDEAYFSALREYCGSRGEFIADSHRYYVDFHRSFSGETVCPLHDSAAVAFLLAPELFTTIEQPVRVVTEGIAIGQTIHGNDTREYVSSAWNGVRRSTICTDVDGQGVLDLCLTILRQRG